MTRPSTKKIALVGECMLELQGQAFGAMRQTFGGDTLNTAVYLARCTAARGWQVFYATALGDDALSDGLMQRWTDERIHLDLVRRLPGRLPGLYLIETDARGERRFSYWRDTSAAKAYFDTGTTALEERRDDWDALYLSGISLAILPPAGRERLFALMSSLRECGKAVAFDSNYRPRLWPDRDDARAAFSRAFALATIAFVSVDDQQALFELPDLHAAMISARTLPTPELIVKNGAAPTWVRSAAGDCASVPTERVESVVDTTAAGDSFAAGYLAERLAGASAEAAARFGNRLAARVIGYPGALIPVEAMASFQL